MHQDKLSFLSNLFVPLLNNLQADAVGKWGKMSGQQMVEHVAGFFRVSTGKIVFPLVTPVEHLPKFKEFLYSEKEFREKYQSSNAARRPAAGRVCNNAESCSRSGYSGKRVYK